MDGWIEIEIEIESTILISNSGDPYVCDSFVHSYNNFYLVTFYVIITNEIFSPVAPINLFIF